MKESRLLLSLLLACVVLVFPHAANAQTTFVCVETNMGEFCMEMQTADAPNTVANFLNYVRSNRYDNTFIHRSEPNFMIQGGGYKLEPLGEEVPADAEIANEFKLSNLRATVAMAKFPEQPDSAASEWFINLTDNSDTLDISNGGYTVFAKVIKGMPVVDAIGRSLRVDLRSQLGDVFSAVPVLQRDDDGVGLEDLVQILRVYEAENVTPDPDSPSEEEAERQRIFQCVSDWITELAPTKVCMSTSQGDFCIDLLPAEAPLNVANFLHYVADGDYDNTFFHRTVADFVVQGGGYRISPLFSPVPADPAVVNEFNVSNTRGTIAMAKFPGDPNSATSEWFVNLKDNMTPLDTDNGGYTVFGTIDAAGMEVFDRIAALPTYPLFDLSGQQDQNMSPFNELPLQNADQAGGLNTGKLVRISQAWIDGAGPNPCIIPKPAALAEYAKRAFDLPVRISDKLYHLYFTQDFTSSGFVFSVDIFKILQLVDKGQEAATFAVADGLLTIPSVLVSGAVITNVKLRMTNPATLQFTLESFDPPQ